MSIEALDKLIAATEAGETSRVHIERYSAEAGLPEAGSLYGAAYQDDLNAARTLSIALMPEWAAVITTSGHVHLIHPYRRRDDKIETGKLLGRIWLIACLKAYRSEVVK